jgi:D-3-phosphoglycerate dehydrogenase
MQIATQRGFRVVEQREPGAAHMDAIRIEVNTEAGNFPVLGAVVLDKPRLLQVENIACEATLGGNLMYSRNDDVPGVIGFVGTCLGKNGVNVASFALGRQEESTRESQGPLTAIAIVQTDSPVPDSVISQLLENPALKFARRVVL